MNAQIVLEKTISLIQEAGLRPSLLLHACCAPCASYVLEYLSPYFDISIFYFNPNIYPPQEYSRRLEELRRMLKDMDSTAVLIEGAYEPHMLCTEAGRNGKAGREGRIRLFRHYPQHQSAQGRREAERTWPRSVRQVRGRLPRVRFQEEKRIPPLAGAFPAIWPLPAGILRLYALHAAAGLAPSKPAAAGKTCLSGTGSSPHVPGCRFLQWAPGRIKRDPAEP